MTASVRSGADARGRLDGGSGTPDPLTALHLLLDHELAGVRRHPLGPAGRVPDAVAPYVDPSRGMLEFLVDAAGGVEDPEIVVLAVAPGARGDTVVPLLPAPWVPEDAGAADVSGDAPFDEVVGEALEDVSRIVAHPERPHEMRGLVLHVGGRMLVVYADLWELRVTLLP